MKILIMGLPGSGKTTLAKKMFNYMSVVDTPTVSWSNADMVRGYHNDWDFSMEGRERQAKRMKKIAEKSTSDYFICDFIAPTQAIRNLFAADYTIWMNTISKSKYIDTNEIFEQPTTADLIITNFDYDIEEIVNKITVDFK